MYLDACSQFEVACTRFFESKELDATRPDIREALDDEIPFLASIETSVASAKINLLRLKNTSMVVSPIAQLPTEILTRIFALAVNSYRTFRPGDLSIIQLNTIASVCCHWRNAALETATLWSYIDCETLNRIGYAHLWLDRARDCPLDILATSQLQPSASSDIHRSMFPLLIPRINNLRSITLFSDSEIAQAWVWEWCQNGVPHTLTTLVIHLQLGSSVEFPVKAGSTTQQRLDELIYPINTLNLSCLRINWDLLTCRNLVTLCLMDITVTIETLGRVLLANPKLECIHLSELSTTEPISTLTLPPIPLGWLHTFELDEVDLDDMSYLLAKLMPGNRGCNLKLLSKGSWSFSAAFRDEFLELCRRSNLKALCCPASEVLEHVIDAVPRLEVLTFTRMELSDSVYDSLFLPDSDDVDMPPEQEQSRLPHLHTLCAHWCDLNDVDGLRRLVSACSIQKIDISEDFCHIEHRKISDVEEFERWIGPGVDVGCLPADWNLGYSPFAS